MNRISISERKQGIRIQQIRDRAIQLIPQKIGTLLDQASSWRTRAFLLPREFQFFFNRAPTLAIQEAALVRFFTTELIREAGVKKFGKTPEYQGAKKDVLTAIVQYLKDNPAIERRFLEVAEGRGRNIFSRTRRVLAKARKR